MHAHAQCQPHPLQHKWSSPTIISILGANKKFESATECEGDLQELKKHMMIEYGLPSLQSLFQTSLCFIYTQCGE